MGLTLPLHISKLKTNKMKRIFTLLMVLPFYLYAMAQQIPAFPGAEGFGRYTTGGRGGKVIHVTNLQDSGTGSLRWALNQSGRRIIVFDVGGTIELESELKIGRGDVTIMGQTAPGDGICLSGFNLTTAADNIIIRFLRVRPGDKTEASDGKDAMGGRFKKDIIIDHCSSSWSTDEACSFYVNQNFTLQWCYITESLRESGHSKGAHGYGGIWGGESASFHHNLLAHHDSRNPRFSGSGNNHRVNLPVEADVVDMRNCVVYNWGGKVGYGAEGGSYNLVNNYYKPGPGSRLKSGEFQAMDKDAGNSGNEANAHGVFFVSGNYYVGKGANWDWNGMRNNTLDPVEKCKSETAFAKGEVTTHTAEQAFTQVLAYGGCSLKRDAIDTRIAHEAETGTTTYKGSKSGYMGIIDTPSDVGGWPEYKDGERLPDSDNDGMPDVWETANGLNPNDASDAQAYTIDPKGWYTNIEVYCNWLVEDIMKAGNQNAIETVEEYYPTVVSVDLGQTGINQLSSFNVPRNASLSKGERSTFYDMTGRRVDADYRGLVIERVTYDNGQTITNKYMNR
jgi:hypothetical protein